MKKVIMSKIDHNETTNRALSLANQEPPPVQDKKPDIQPPLPPEPPPPDTPYPSFALKEEVEDTDYMYQEDCMQEYYEGYTPEPAIESAPKPTMCRDYMRGKCTRATCRYSHVCDVTQLKSLFTFCQDYQNSVCTRPYCRYVHASVFEEQHFYRTGELSPQAFAHQEAAALPPPPPPPPPPPEEPPSDVMAFYSRPPPQLPTSDQYSVEDPLPAICIAASKMDQGPYEDESSSLFGSEMSSPPKSDWSTAEMFGSSLMEADSEPEQWPQHCQNCEWGEFRLEFLKDKYDKMEKAKYEHYRNMEILLKKRDKLQSTLMSLSKPAQPPTYQPSIGSSMLGLSPNVGVDRQKWVMEQLAASFNTSPMSGYLEDTNKSNFNSNPNLMAVLDTLLKLYHD